MKKNWRLTGAVIVAGVALLIAERRRPLRRRVESQGRRSVQNAAELALSAIVVQSLQTPLLSDFADTIDRRRLGVANLLPAPRWLRRAVAFLLLDYTLWWWHYANHRVPFLWRFHLVHHIDRDLDVTTAARFHFGEMAMSVPLRYLQVLVSGADAATLGAWQSVLMFCVAFHHSNLDLGEANDRQAAAFVVTPRMHGIHHSDVLEHTDSNWSSIFTIWDRLHGTLRLDVAQESIRIGVPAWQSGDDVSLADLTLMPFRPQRRDWDESELRAIEIETRAASHE